MPQIKSHKTVEEIAKKHRLDVSFIQKQLDMGHPIEHEHTKNSDLATYIALQHLDEIPDYYTRLKKMEADAKKHHKKFKDVKEDLRRWFDKDDPEGNWRRFNTKGEPIGPCAREPGEPKPKCLSNEKTAKMSKGEIAAAVRRKRKADPVANRKGKGGTPIMSSNRIGEEHTREEMRYCPLCDKRETRSECSYGEKAWDKVSVKDEEYSMARGELETIMNAAKRLRNTVGKGEGNLEAWVQSKITKAADYIDTVADYIDGGEAKMQESCWTGYKQIGMKKKGKKMVPNCVSENISLTDKILWEIEAESLSEENQPTNPKLWSKAKSLARQKFDVYPSAYANGWASKWYKSKGGKWKSANESVTIEDADGNTFAEVVDLIEPDSIKGFRCQIEEATRLQAQTGNIIAVTLSWRAKYYSVKMFFPQAKLPTRKEISDELQKVYPGSNVVYYSISQFQPGQPLIQAFGPQGGSSAKPGPNKNYVKPMGEEVELKEVAAWQRKEGKNKSGGLNEKGRTSYERANPGSDLKAPSKKVGNPRRKSFCARMSGMKKKLTSAKTANDPNSRINKSLRAWNC